MISNLNFGEKLKDIRLEKKLTQSELADMVGCSAIAISRYENDKREPNMEVLKKIADALNIDIGYFFQDVYKTYEDWLTYLHKSIFNNDTEPDHYYIDPEVSEIAQQIKENPGKRALFDATRDVSKEDIDKVLQIINVITENK